MYWNWHIAIYVFIEMHQNKYDELEYLKQLTGFPGGLGGKKSACNGGDPGWEGLLEKGTATHSSIFTWRIPWTEETGRLSMGSHRVGNN